jgi:hypothetical protein
MRQERKIYFMSFHLNSDNILYGIGIFWIHPDVVEVGFVENARELGELQQIRKR